MRAGRYVHGERLAITDFAQDLDLSATPVREALSRLAGEGLIEERRGQGYFAWRLDVVDLAELYELQGEHLNFALERAGVRPGGLVPVHEEALEDAEALFAQIVRQSDNAALVRANRLLADRLAAPRLAEARVLCDLDQELKELVSLRHPEALKPALAAYHLRRLARSQAIIAALRNLTSEAAENIVSL